MDAVRYFRPYSVENAGGQSRPYLRNYGGQVGSAETNVTVTVNEVEADRQGHYPALSRPHESRDYAGTSWYHRMEVDNLYNAIYTQVVVEAIFDQGTNDPYVVSSETGNVFVAESPESFSYVYVYGLVDNMVSWSDILMRKLNDVKAGNVPSRAWISSPNGKNIEKHYTMVASGALKTC